VQHDQFENMAIPPFGDQPTNMPIPAQLPPQHLLRFGNGGLLF